MKNIHKIDAVTSAIVLTGTFSSALINLITIKGNTNRATPLLRIGYSITALAASYRLLRILAPKTKQEQRMEQAAYLYSQAEVYQRRAADYRRNAEDFVRRHLNTAKSVISS